MFKNLFDRSVSRFLIIILFVELIVIIRSQDCVDYHLQAGKCIEKNPFEQLQFSHRTIRSHTVQQPKSPARCGKSMSVFGRVVGGNEARIGNYPWIAALGYRDEDAPRALKFLCGGSLISSRYVITAAHCINSKLMLVRLGAHNLSNSAEPVARNYGIKRSITHEEFLLNKIVHDLALVELNDTVVMTKFIHTICLPEDPKFLEKEFVDSYPFIAGWGATKHQARTSDVLRDVQVPIINIQECVQSYSVFVNFENFTDKLICAGNSIVDSCHGDSGGPLMMPQMIGSSSQYYIIGVVSFGFECASPEFPGVYTRVAAYIPWIKSNMI